MKKLLITGASGFLGYHLMRVAAPHWEVYGVTHTNGFDFKQATPIVCDIRNYIDLGNVVEDVEPDAVIHAAAIGDVNFCEQNKALSYEINVEATKNLAGICSDYNIPFGFTSTDLVFDGVDGMYQETSPINPVTAYGEQKALAEQEIHKIIPSAAIFRLSLMFGEPHASPSNYIQQFISRIQQGIKAPLFYDEYRCVCGARSISEGILSLLEHHTGIIHLAGREKLSRYDFGMKAVNAFNLDVSLVERCSQKDVKMSARRPPDVSLNISKALRLGFSPLTVDDELKLIASNTYFK